MMKMSHFTMQRKKSQGTKPSTRSPPEKDSKCQLSSKEKMMRRLPSTTPHVPMMKWSPMPSRYSNRKSPERNYIWIPTSLPKKRESPRK